MVLLIQAPGPAGRAAIFVRRCTRTRIIPAGSLVKSQVVTGPLQSVVGDPPAVWCQWRWRVVPVVRLRVGAGGVPSLTRPRLGETLDPS